MPQTFTENYINFSSYKDIDIPKEGIRWQACGGHYKFLDRPAC